MRFFLAPHLTPRLGLALFSLALPGFAAAQTLTPGAAAIGGTTTDAQLIAPNGTSSDGSIVVPVATETTARTVHTPDPNWPLILPAPRGGSGAPIEATVAGSAAAAPSASGSTVPTVSQPATTATSTTVTTDTNTTSTSAATTEAAANTAAIPSSESSGNDTTQVTASATPETSPSNTAVDVSAANTPALNPLQDFDQAELNFGPLGVDLTAQHEISLDPVVALMRVSPTTPLRVVAVLAQAEASNEDAKLLARRRILAVRRYLIEQGLSADNLTFVIAANSSTEQFANYVLIER